MPPTIRVDDDVYSYLQSQARPFVDTPNDVLRRLLPIGRDGGDGQGRTTKHRKAPGALLPLVEAGRLIAGDELRWERRNLSEGHRSVVTQDGEVELEDGSVFPTPSAAAKALSGYEVNGWKVWTVSRTGRLLSDERRLLSRGARESEGGSAPGLRSVAQSPSVAARPIALGDQAFLDDLPTDLQQLGTRLLAEVRTRWSGSLRTSQTGRYIETPDNFWTVKIQPRDVSLAITVRGEPGVFGSSPLEIKPDRSAYSRFKISRLDEIPAAIEVIRRASKVRQ